jgi:hypothetical protein
MPIGLCTSTSIEHDPNWKIQLKVYILTNRKNVDISDKQVPTTKHPTTNLKKFTWDNLVLRFKIETQSALGTFELNLLLLLDCFDLLESSFFFSPWTHISWIETNKTCIVFITRPHTHTLPFPDSRAECCFVPFYICANLHRNCFVWYPTAYIFSFCV